MPTYVYMCSKCGSSMEIDAKISEKDKLDKETHCIHCNTLMRSSLKDNSFRMRIKHEI